MAPAIQLESCITPWQSLQCIIKSSYMWLREDQADLAHYGKYNLEPCFEEGWNKKEMQTPSADAHRIKTPNPPFLHPAL